MAAPSDLPAPRFHPQDHPQSAFEMKDLEDMIRDPYFLYDADEPYFPHPPVDQIDEGRIRELFQSYFFKHSIIRQQTESFDFFMEVLLPAIIKENQRVEVISKKQQTKHVIEFHNVVVCKPMFKENDGTVHDIDPVECMVRKATYSSSILVDVTHNTYERRLRAPAAGATSSSASSSGPTAPSLTTSSAPTSSSSRPTASLPPTRPTNILRDQLSREEEEMRNEEVRMDQDRPDDLAEDEGPEDDAPPLPLENDPQAEYDDVLLESRVYEQHTLFRQPVMVGSKYCHTHSHTYAGSCPYVPGGYFLVNGNEKVVMPQEKLRNNYFYVTHDKTGKSIYKGEIRSWNEHKIRTTSTLYAYLSCSRGGTLPGIAFDVPFIKGSIPLPQVFRLIGVQNTWEMRRYILARFDYAQEHPYDHYIRSILKDEHSELTLDELKVHIAKKGVTEPTKERRVRYVDNIFFNEFLPHMGLERNEEVQHKKAMFLGYMVMKLLRIYHGEQESDDRDDYANKRLDPVHMLFALLLRQLFRAFLKTFTSQIHKAAENEKHIFVIDMMKNSKRITAGFKYALTKGVWGISKGGSTQTGVAQVLTRMTPISTICHMRRTNTPINRDGKMSQPRQLHTSAWGLSCSHESPEGAACGLIKNMALTTYIRLGYPSQPVIDILKYHFKMILDASAEEVRTGTWVFINGTLWGVVPATEAEGFVQRVRRWRRIQDLPFSASVTYHQHLREVHIVMDSGCCLRPVFVLENLHRFGEIYHLHRHNRGLLWDKMISHGIIEYLDKEEESIMRVAVLWSDLEVPRRQHEQPYTHIEIHPLVIMGISASFVPLSNHDQAPRITYGSCMLKQGVGKVGLNSDKRFDTSGVHELFYPQIPLVSSFTERQSRLNDLPYGENVVVAIMSYTGYNQEDSLILNKGAVDRGLFRSLYFRTYKDTARNAGSEQEVFEIPDVKDVTGIKRTNYALLGPDALPALHQIVEQDDVLIGKIIKPTDTSKAQEGEGTKKDRSTLYRNKEQARVDKVATTLTKDGATLVNVRTRSLRVPTMGNKYSSRHGQKGVCGLVLPSEDMPYTADGITPDVIMNPHAIPSRMTVAQILETLLGKAGVMKGKIGDGTAFAHLEDYLDEIYDDQGQRRRDPGDTSGHTNGHTNDDPTDGGSTPRPPSWLGPAPQPKTVLLAERIGNVLHAAGFNRYGNERMYNGMTGELLEAQIFIGPCHYMALKHMVVDKVHARSTGPRQILTRQPVEGRSRDGGLRWGEMERDSLLSHGASAVLQDRLLEVSDKYKTVVCERCGLFAIPAPPKARPTDRLLGTTSQAYCRNCKSSDHIKMTVMPYAFSVLVRDMEAFHISMRMELTSQS